MTKEIRARLNQNHDVRGLLGSFWPIAVENIIVVAKPRCKTLSSSMEKGSRQATYICKRIQATQAMLRNRSIQVESGGIDLVSVDCNIEYLWWERKLKEIKPFTIGSLPARGSLPGIDPLPDSDLLCEPIFIGHSTFSDHQVIPPNPFLLEVTNGSWMNRVPGHQPFGRGLNGGGV